jgi:E3 ubiquitin-protein ligase UBR4
MDICIETANNFDLVTPVFIFERLCNIIYPEEIVDAKQCELIALLEDDNGMELLVNYKIISLDLPVRDVYKKGIK